MFEALFPSRLARRLGLPLLAMLLGVSLAGTAPVQAQTSHLRLTAASFGATQNLNIDLNKSVIVDLPTDVKEVIVSQPTVAPTIMRTKRRAIVQGLGMGSTNIFFLDGAGRAISILDVSVLDTSADRADSSTLAAALRRVIPGSNIRVESFDEGGVVLSGTVASGDDIERASGIATQFTGDPDKVANFIGVGGGQQVMLKVVIAEVERETIKQLGINLDATVSAGGTSVGFVSNQPLGGASGAVPTGSIGVNIAGANYSIEAMLRALERRGAVHKLAEPTLTAMSGSPAEFLVGGQFPVRFEDEDGKIVTSFKDWGVKLNFTPTVKSDGQIALLIDTSVSEPTNDSLALTQRSVKTNVQLAAGQTLSIAGILQDSVRQQINQFPGLGDIPILGALFRSRDFIRRRTELVIMVTPYIAETGRPVLPTDKSVIASDAEAIFLGRLETMYGVGGPTKNELRGGYSGSVGFILD